MKVLIVNLFKVGDQNATGNTLENMLIGIDDTKYFQICLLPIKDDNNIVNTMHVRPIDNIFLYILMKFSNFIHKTNSTKVFKSNNEVFGTDVTNSKRKEVLYKIKKALVHYSRMRKVHINSLIYRKIKKFDPDVIYTLGGSYSALRAAYDISLKLGKNIIVHSMDDFYNTEFVGGGFFNKLLRKRYLRITDLTYERSMMSIGISEDMAIEYSKEFNLPFTYAMNCVNYFHSNVITYDNQEKSDFILIIFSGGLHGGRYNSILEMAQLIEKINREDGKKFFLEVYTDPVDYSNYGGSINSYVSVHKYVLKEDMFKNLTRADILLHVESFEKEYIDYFRLSMSTKIPEYMSTFVPILCYGSSEVCSVRFVKENNCGLVAENINELRNILYDIKNDRYNLLSYSKNAYEIAIKKFGKESTQKRIYDCFVVNCK